MTQKLITIVTPCYKTNLYFLERLTETVLNNIGNIEWIIVDDSPNSEELDQLFSRFKNHHCDIICIKHEKNLGISQSYRTGFNASSGKYVGIVDHDDELYLDGIIDEMLLAASLDYDIIYTGEARFNQYIVDKSIKPVADPLSSYYYYYPHHFTLFKGSTARMITEKWGGCFDYATTTFDIAFWYEYIIKFSGRTIRAYFIQEIAYGWRMHADSTALGINQKPKHITERKSIAAQFFANTEDGFSIETRKDIPFIITGVFGLKFIKIMDYIKSCYDVEINIPVGSLHSSSEEMLSNNIIEQKLRQVPFKTLSTHNPSVVIYFSIPIIRELKCSHFKGVPFLRRVQSLKCIKEKLHVSLKSKYADDQLRLEPYELVFASEWE